MYYVKIFRKKYGLVRDLYFTKFVIRSENAERMGQILLVFRQIAEPFGDPSKQHPECLEEFR